MKTLVRRRADLVFFSQDGKPLMLVEVKARSAETQFARPQLTGYLEEAETLTPYAMLVTLDDLFFFEWDGQALRELLAARTADVLSFYDPEFGDKPIYEYYLTTLVESWLRDVAYHWKSDAPPLFDRLREIGLAEMLHNGSTNREVEV
jgi:type I site-specific restriction endonuclease